MVPDADIADSDELLETFFDKKVDEAVEDATEAAAETGEATVEEVLTETEEAANEWPAEGRWTTMDGIPMPEEVREGAAAEEAEAAEEVSHDER